MYIIKESPMMSRPKNIKNIKDKIRMECVLQTVGDVNRNKRIYEKTTLQESINDLGDRIKQKQLLGELDHPTDQSPSRQLTVHYTCASHVFREVGWEGNKLKGVLETVRTPNGNILKNLAEDGIMIGFSYRGMGDLKPMMEGGQQVFKVTGPLQTITWDAVSFPSHKEANIVQITESVRMGLMESIDVNSIISESSNQICMENADGKVVCYLPNDFDFLVEQKKKLLYNKFNL